MNLSDPYGLFGWGKAIDWLIKKGLKWLGKRGAKGLTPEMGDWRDQDFYNQYEPYDPVKNPNAPKDNTHMPSDWNEDWDNDGIPNWQDSDKDGDHIPDDLDWDIEEPEEEGERGKCK